LEYQITDDLEKLKSVLPSYLVDALEAEGRSDQLIEVIMDLGRVPTARYADGEKVLDTREITHENIRYVVERIGAFDADNRAGLERTLHRISGIRNRKRDIVGLTVRIGRAVYGTIDIIQDIIESGASVLFLGAPGVGKTTMLREVARVLAEDKRVVIVDTSNEIGGDGDVPHPAVGRARRMQVQEPQLQHEVMIEAVENHNPQVIVIDEIGRELEAQAARTIAERGVQLIGTAHGQTLDNLMQNPTLSDLIGGIESVTLSDEEARRRGTQKVVLERRAPPTFDVLVELQTRHSLVIHEDVTASVDGALRGRPIAVERRIRTEDGTIHSEMVMPTTSMLETRDGRDDMRSSREFRDDRRGSRGMPMMGGMQDRFTGRTPERRDFGRDYGREAGREMGRTVPPMHGVPRSEPRSESRTETRAEMLEGAANNGSNRPHQTLHIYAYGVARNRLEQAAKRLHVPVLVEDSLEQAQAVLTLKNYYRRRPKLIVDAERRGMGIYVLRANTVSQMEDFLVDVFGLDDQPSGDDGGNGGFGGSGGTGSNRYPGAPAGMSGSPARRF
jgi:stage III sporulation protein AA